MTRCTKFVTHWYPKFDPLLFSAKVGYCQRINHYPKIYVTESDRTVNIGVTYAEGDVG